jgi:DNA polymerase
MICIDFETRSGCGLKKEGVYRYAKDVTTEILCLVYVINGKATTWSPLIPAISSLEILKPLYDAIQNLEDIESHNINFERLIWNNIMVRDFGAPIIFDFQCFCSAANASALALPRSLDGVANALRLPVQKDMGGKSLMLKMTKLRKRVTMEDPSVWREQIQELLKLAAYCKTDTLVEVEIGKTIPPLSENEREVFLLDMKINDRGLPIDMKSVYIAQSFVERYIEELTLELKQITGGRVETHGQTEKIKEFLASHGLFLETLTAAVVEENINFPKIQPLAKRVLEIRQACSKSSTKKLKALELLVVDGRVYGSLMYHGASTGRWTGKGFQPQNLPRGELKDIDKAFKLLNKNNYQEFKKEYPDVLDVISSMIRGMIKAGPGKKIMTCDFASIEARGLFWLTGCKEGLALYRDGGGKAYEEMAATIYNTSPDKILKGSFERQLGKQAILGFGYGMGAPKFIVTCGGYGMEVSEDLANRAKMAYRTRFKEVVTFWYEVEACAIKAVKFPGLVVPCRRVQFKKVGNFLYCKLPSGRKIAYAYPKIELAESPFGLKEQLQYMAVDSKTKQWTTERTYGGKITENIVQAISRDVMVEAMFRVEAAGYPTILTVHDELVSECDIGKSLKEYENLMRQVPAWAEGFPIDVEGGEGERFKK